MATAIRRVYSQNLKPGMILANPIMSDARSLLVAEKTSLTQAIIDRIILSGIRYADILLETALPESPVQGSKDILIEKHVRITHAVKDSFDRMRLSRTLPHEEFLDISNEISSTMLDTPGIFHSLQTVKSVDNYTYVHSINVGVLSGLIGKWTGYSNVPILILAGLLHDVGKTQIPLEILNKPSSLSPFEMCVMQRHAKLGYEMALGNGNFSDEVMEGILFHHERFDGTGYPTGVKGEKLSDVPKIIAVADLFDSMTSDRVYRSALSPFDVLEEIYDEMFSRLDPAICYIFRQRVKELLVGSEVVLSDGRRARIVFVDGGDHYKPILQDEQGEAFSPGEMNLHIVKFS